MVKAASLQKALESDARNQLPQAANVTRRHQLPAEALA
jgi:hypothetical protein